MSGLLAAAKILFAERNIFKGSVKLIFQPAEEGLGGATEMLKDGVFEEGRLGPRVDFVYGLHLWSFDALVTLTTTYSHPHSMPDNHLFTL